MSDRCWCDCGRGCACACHTPPTMVAGANSGAGRGEVPAYPPTRDDAAVAEACIMYRKSRERLDHAHVMEYGDFDHHSTVTAIAAALQAARQQERERCPCYCPDADHTVRGEA